MNEHASEPAPANSVTSGVKAGARDAKAAASSFLPAAGRVVSKTVYGSSYVASYALVFPATLIASYLPKKNAVAYGMADGATAAKDAVRRFRSKADNAVEHAAEATFSVAPAPA